MKQSSILSFLTQGYKEPTPMACPKTQGLAEEILTPLFVRQVEDNLKYKKQLEEEFALIDKNNFTKVFVQVKTIFELIHELGEEGKPIPHIIRGSAGSSLVCFLLGITHIDPILHGIQIARFMNTERRDMPDIDIDVPYNRREEIYSRIAEHWPGMVARVSNHVKYTTKVALREVVKEMLDIPTMPAGLRKRDYDIRKFLPEKADQEKAVQKAKEMNGTFKNYSKHCGGIVIFDEEGKVPEELIYKEIKANETSLFQIKLDKDQTEDAGFIKVDVLSNRGLAQIADICPERPFFKYPTRDYSTERIFEKGWTIGITFGESRGMRKLFMEMKPTCIRDVAIALALIRPAAAAEGRKQEFLGKWKQCLPETSPLERAIIFDDDAICKIRRALQCSFGEADQWRRHFAKGNERGKAQFRQLMLEKGHTKGLVDSVMDDLNQLIYYSFCKSHAVSYAQLVWALAYWKAHRNHEFWVAALNHCHSEYRKWVHYREARCAGLLLSTHKPPYKLGTRNGQPALVASQSEQSLLRPLSPVQEFRQYGYWTTEEFLPTCGLFRSSQTCLDHRQLVKFRGVIACGRTVSRDWGNCTLLCLGVANRHYVDVVIAEKHRRDLFRYAVLEGDGFLTTRGGIETVEVKSIRGVSLTNLITNKK